MMGSLYHALLRASVPDADAREAAQAVAAFDARIARVENELSVLKWMVGTNIALTLIAIGCLFRL
jgi:glutathione S-transferase